MLQSQAVSADGIVWHDCKELGIEGKGWTDTPGFYDRIPSRYEGKVSKSVWELSHNTAGFCVRFTTDAPVLHIRWTVTSTTLGMPHMAATGVSGVDLYAKANEGQWRFLGNGRPEAVSNTAIIGIPPAGEYLLYLPLYNGVKSLEIGVPKGRHISGVKLPANRKPVVIYGTSITQGGCVSRPGTAWTSIVGRRLEVPIINLGFSGSGVMEPIMADLLVELDPSVYVLDCIWNMQPDMVKDRVAPFVKKLRTAHSKTPILLAEDCNFQNVSPTPKGQLLRDVYERLVADGVTNLHFLSNKNMLGEDTEGTVDGCHPTDAGMLRMADVFVPALRPLINQ